MTRDFVELPSQLYENWLSEKDVLSRFARHYRTGEPMPGALIDRVLAAENFGQGFASVEYTASALVDLEMHLVEDAEDFDPMAFEKQVLDGVGMPEEIVMRHRTPHFAHVFAGEGIRVHDRTARQVGPPLLALRLAALGRGEERVAVAPGEVTSDGARVEIRRPEGW